MKNDQYSPFVLALHNASATLEQVGGKGASLARMAVAGLPVPAGFHVTTTAYRRFVTENGLQEQILSAVSAVAADQPATLEEASKQIAGLFAQSVMPDVIAGAIRHAYVALGGDDLPVAVRSSATAEDLPELSFAGQQETYLNIHGAAMVLDAVKRCWASLWTARAIGYRARHGIAQEDVSLAVVVQELVPAGAAGIMFTANPVTGARDQVIINAAWGLGEAIVGGQVTPDTVVVEKVSGAITRQEITEKDVTTRLSRQKDAQAAAWERFQQRSPRMAARMHRRIDRAAAVARNREATRSEQVRVFWALRAFVLRAGALTGQGEDLFFLSIDEILAVLGGDDAPLSSIPARRATYARYHSLPPYPTLIRGHFDPFQWAADPQRRNDVFDASGSSRAPASSTITGFPGAAGVVEGRARVIATTDEGDQLQPAEILVTTVTNVGWTPLFPRAAAVVTDVGTPLSHAAIVTREIGIPVVVGCGNATMRLHTGDWVRVNGGQGTVEVLRAADAVTSTIRV